MRRQTSEVVLCTYNGERHLAQQLQSILGQTRAVDLVSIYDDGSVDASMAIMQAMASAANADGGPRIHVTRNHVTLGYAGNFAQGLAHADADVIFLCDQDDIWEPTKIASFMDIFEQAGATVDMVFSDGTLIDASGNPLADSTVLASYGLTGRRRQRFDVESFAQLLRRNVVNGAACAIRRPCAQASLPLPEQWPHDYWLALWAAAHGGLQVNTQVLWRYRQHDGNAIGMGSNRWLYQWLGIWRQPDAPRQRELRMVRQLAERLAPLQDQAAMAALVRAKHDWLASVLDTSVGFWRRLARIVRSVVSGQYRRFSPGDALLRDLVSLVKPRAR